VLEDCEHDVTGGCGIRAIQTGSKEMVGEERFYLVDLGQLS
jgi:hypothetical protein